MGKKYIVGRIYMEEIGSIYETGNDKYLFQGPISSEDNWNRYKIISSNGNDVCGDYKPGFIENNEMFIFIGDNPWERRVMFYDEIEFEVNSEEEAIERFNKETKKK